MDSASAPRALRLSIGNSLNSDNNSPDDMVFSNKGITFYEEKMYVLPPLDGVQRRDFRCMDFMNG